MSQSVKINALAHITGGGITENLPRVLPKNTQAVIQTSSWQIPEIFNWLQEKGNVTQQEMYRTFNCGIGMIVCVAEANVSQALKILNNHNRGAFEIGVIRPCNNDDHAVVLNSD